MESKQEQIYGRQLMTRQERDEYRVKMRSAETAEQREKIRREHHEAMKERAIMQGVNLPDEPPIRDGGMGIGPGGGKKRNVDRAPGSGKGRY
ncbi:MAG: hypothetical protein ACI9Y1_003606 [Lentisphaeria bacterium]|jgi:hypothetical protein